MLIINNNVTNLYAKKGVYRYIRRFLKKVTHTQTNTSNLGGVCCIGDKINKLTIIMETRRLYYYF